MTGQKRTRAIRSALFIILLSAFAGAPAGAICILPNEPFQVLDFHLDIDPADWDAIRHDTTFNDERPATFHCGDEIPGLVSVRRKPTIAIPNETDPRKVSLKIDLDEFVLGQEWNSHRKINLENGGPGALVREGVAWLLMARAGVITSGATWVRLHVNGEVIGIYVRAEQIDKAFLRRHLNEDLGFLYKEGVQRTREGQVDPHAAALCYPPFANLCPLPADGYASLHQDLDVVQLLTLGAVNAFLVNNDGLLGKTANHWWYNSPLPRRYFAWDLDTFMPTGGTGADPHDIGNGQFESLLLGDPDLSSLFDTILLRLINDPFHPDSIDRLLDRLAPALGTAIDADLDNNLGQSFAEELEEIRTWMHDRAALLAPQLPAYQPFPVVINEIVASNQTTFTDEIGEYADWVELYNRSASPVSLDGLYMSDSPAFPTRFAFPAGTTIPAGGYAIVWFDNDILQGPLHVGVKLEADGETVGLFASDADRNRVLDFVWFDKQAQDVSIGRFPDGNHGIHTLQAATPGAANVAPTLGAGTIGPSLTVTRGIGSNIRLRWQPSCAPDAQEYAIYEGSIGTWYNHSLVDCTDDLSNLIEEIVALPGNRYYVVVPRRVVDEGSYGTDSNGAERPPGALVCAPAQLIDTCGP